MAPEKTVEWERRREVARDGEASAPVGSEDVAAEVRKAEIYRAAARIFCDKGYHATSIHEIAVAVNLTKAGLYYYIKGKQDLLFQIMDYAMDLLEQRVLEPSRQFEEPATRLRAVVDAHARLIIEGASALTILVRELEALSDEHRASTAGRQRAYVEYLRDTIDSLPRRAHAAARGDAGERGKLRPVDSTVGAFGLLGMILWLSRWYRPDGRLGEDEVVAEITRMALCAVGADPES